MIVEEIAAEARKAGNLVRHVEVVALEEILPAVLGADLLEQALHRGGVERRPGQGQERAGDPGLGREPDREVQVGTALFEGCAEECVDRCHGQEIFARSTRFVMLASAIGAVIWLSSHSE